jgi:hypothetical protein
MGASRRFARLAACLVLGTSSAGALARDEPLQLAPSSKWIMDYAEGSCALRRAFEGGGEQVMLELRQFGPGQTFQVVLTSATLSRASGAPRVKFDPDDDFEEQEEVLVFNQDGANGIVYRDSLWTSAAESAASFPEWTDAEREAREGAITGLTVVNGFRRNLTLQTGSLRQPMDAMRTCLDELLTHWGLDPAVQRNLSRPVKPIDRQSWARQILADYPDRPRMERELSGRVNVRLIVGADGKPVSCVASKDAASQPFEERVCNTLMQYARLEPALDADGHPVASYFTTAIIYQIGR